MFAVGASVTLAPNYAEAATSALYSDPVYWPLHVQSYVDCTMTNPGCSNHHDFYGVDVIPTGQRSGAPLSQAGVYSMGAGIAHIGDAKGAACGTGTATDFGTWVWVDHGGGVVSRYGHLSKIDIAEGQHVAAGALLGVVGNTGDSSTLYCDENYLDFQVLRNGYHGPSVPFSTKGTGSPDGDLLGCSTESLQLWPLNLSVGITTIEAMPEKTDVPASSNDCLPRYTAASLPGAPGLHLTAMPHAVQATWTGSLPAGADNVRIEVGAYHPSTKAYDSQWNESWRDVNTSIRTATKGSLKRKTKYRVRVWFHTAQGWVANTGYQSITTK
jgi:murein DD-endopeptidase MepM/ murein hydrolase activator NlpD